MKRCDSMFCCDHCGTCFCGEPSDLIEAAEELSETFSDGPGVSPETAKLEAGFARLRAAIKQEKGE